MGYLASFSPLSVGQPAREKKLNRIGLILLMAWEWVLAAVSWDWPETMQPIENSPLPAGPLHPPDDSTEWSAVFTRCSSNHA